VRKWLILLGFVDVEGQKHEYFREDLRCFRFGRAHFQEDLRCFAFGGREAREFVVGARGLPWIVVGMAGKGSKVVAREVSYREGKRRFRAHVRLWRFG
jgi:hypothetical protein